MSTRSYSDGELAQAVATARSWRGALRALGLRGTSAGSLRSVRRRADVLGIDHSHFTGRRTWSDDDLRSAVPACRSWAEVASALGLLASGGTLTGLRAHAHRLGLPTGHLDPRAAAVPSSSLPRFGEYRPEHLRAAGPVFAATFFMLRGLGISWPLEPCRYDLVVDVSGTLHRVQVKTTSGHGPTAHVHVSNSRRAGRAVYAPGEIDSFFVIDADLTAYHVPYADVAGYDQLHLGRYHAFMVVDQGRLVPSACASRGP